MSILLIFYHKCIGIHYLSAFLLKKVEIYEQSPYLKRASGNPLHKVLTKLSKSPRDIEFKQYFSLIKDDDNFKKKFPDKVSSFLTDISNTSQCKYSLELIMHITMARCFNLYLGGWIVKKNIPIRS